MGIGLLLPARGDAADVLDWATKIAIAVLFFLYGTRLEPREAIEGLKHWKLHTTVLAATYVLFPLLGLAMRLLVPSVLTNDLYTGVLYLCLLPSTVQSSIAFTSIARGNVAAAVVSASLSNMLGVFMTPVLVMLLMQTTGEATVSPTAILEIVVQLLLPFVAGQLLRPKLYRILSHTTLTKVVDRGSVYLVVYAAFSAGNGRACVAGSADLPLVGRVRGQHRAAGGGTGCHSGGRTATTVRSGRPHCRDLLRLQEELGDRITHGDRVVRRSPGGLDRAATDDLPPDSTDHLRGPSGTVGTGPEFRCGNRRRRDRLCCLIFAYSGFAITPVRSWVACDG